MLPTRRLPFKAYIRAFILSALVPAPAQTEDLVSAPQASDEDPERHIISYAEGQKITHPRFMNAT
jgi:hypothetical protein